MTFDWGPAGARRLTQAVDVLVVVDALSFSTSVDVAVGRGALVRPVPRAVGGVPRGGSPEQPYTLSPASLIKIPAGTRLALGSPNGATICAEAADAGVTVIAGCLRNATAVGRAVAERGVPAGVVAAGERWPDGALRPAVEDLVGAGAILAAIGGSPSPAARGAIAAAAAVSDAALAGCASARELIEAGFAADVELALARDASAHVPTLDDGWFTSGV